MSKITSLKSCVRLTAALMLLFQFEKVLAQSITLTPSSSNIIQTSSATNYFDVTKTGTNTYAGIRFFQNSLSRGGLFFSDQYDAFNLSNTNSIAGLVWERNTQRVGIGTFNANGRLHILANSTGSVPHLLLEENNNTDGARINFENFSVSNKTWTLYGKNSSSAVPSANEFNIFHSSFGNIAQFYGDGNTKLNGNNITNGFTQLGSDAPNIKIKKLSGTTNVSNSTDVTHGLDFDKILSVDILIKADNGFRYAPQSYQGSINTYRFFITSTIIDINELPTTLQNKPYTIIITHEE